MRKSIAYTCLLGATLALAACDKPSDEERRPVAPTTQETPSQTVPSEPLTPAPQPNDPAPAAAPTYEEN